MKKSEFMIGIDEIEKKSEYKFELYELQYLYENISHISNEDYEQAVIRMVDKIRPYIQIDSHVKFVMRNTIGVTHN